MLLGAHRDLVCAGELKATNLGTADSYLCSCKAHIGDCEFWNAINHRMNARGEVFSIAEAGTDLRTNAGRYERALLSPLVRGKFLEHARDLALSMSPGWHRNLSRILRRNYLLIDSLTEETGARAVVDSSKIGIRLKYLSRIPNLDVKVIWLIRDGRGVCLAYHRPDEFAAARGQNLAGKLTESARDIGQAAREWKRANEEAMNLLSAMSPDSWTRVHYEDLCTHPEQTLDEIFDFIGVPREGKTLDFKSVPHHVIGNSMRLVEDSKIDIDDRWKEVLTLAQIRHFNKVAGSMNNKLGYS